MLSQPRQRVELKALCEHALEAQLDATGAAGIDLGLEAAPVQVMGHEWLLRELLANLVDNALKYAGAGASVTLRCGRRGAHAFLEVEDDGPGVAAAERARILQRFYRVPGTAAEGNGLGLAIAQEIARAHHSQLELQPGTGGRGLKVTLSFAG
jgi:two-component system sensor histidine kinase TctE